MKKDYAINRREFIVTSVGYALAVSPVTALAISTPNEGLVTSDVMIPTGSEKMPGYLALPKGKGPFPTVLVIQEIFGVHEYIKDVCRRFAKEGYAAVAPSLYFRQGDATQVADIQKLIADIVSKVNQEQVFKDLDATMKWLESNSSVNTKRAAITGFCWGGGVTWAYAAHNPKLKAGVAWYGRLEGEKNDNVKIYPLDIAANLTVPVLGLYGAKDKGIPVESVKKMETALKNGKSHSEIVVYPDAEHGFHADYRPSYNEKSAKDGWKRAVAWFKKHGV